MPGSGPADGGVAREPAGGCRCRSRRLVGSAAGETGVTGEDARGWRPSGKAPEARLGVAVGWMLGSLAASLVPLAPFFPFPRAGRAAPCLTPLPGRPPCWQEVTRDRPQLGSHILPPPAPPGKMKVKQHPPCQGGANRPQRGCAHPLALVLQSPRSDPPARLPSAHRMAQRLRDAGGVQGPEGPWAGKLAQCRCPPPDSWLGRRRGASRARQQGGPDKPRAPGWGSDARGSWRSEEPVGPGGVRGGAHRSAGR